MNPFEVLGISPNSTEEEINARWKSLALINHPDMHPNATNEQRAVLERRMAEINAAHDMLMDPTQRFDLRGRYSEAGDTAASTYDGSFSRHPRPPSRPRRNPHGCEICGASPSARLSFKQITGQIIRDLVRTFEARLCRNCGLAIGREFQSRTILTGWWGLFAIFRNIGAIFSNSASLHEASSLDQPSNRPSFVESLPIGKPIFGRPRTWVGIGLVALIAGFAINESNSSSDSFRVGGCVSGYSMVTPISCSKTHTGKITSQRTSPNDCPTTAESYVVYSGATYCIDENR